MDSWKRIIMESWDGGERKPEFTSPAIGSELKSVGALLHVTLPNQLIELYNETDGIRIMPDPLNPDYVEYVILPIRQLIQRNKREWETVTGWQSPRQDLLFIGDPAEGDMYAMRILDNGQIDGDNVYLWTYALNERVHVGSFCQYLRESVRTNE